MWDGSSPPPKQCEAGINPGGFWDVVVREGNRRLERHTCFDLKPHSVRKLWLPVCPDLCQRKVFRLSFTHPTSVFLKRDSEYRFSDCPVVRIMVIRTP